MRDEELEACMRVQAWTRQKKLDGPVTLAPSYL